MSERKYMDCYMGKSVAIKSSDCIVRPRFTQAAMVPHPDAGNQRQRTIEKRVYINTQTSPFHSSIGILETAAATQQRACSGALK